MWSSKVNKNKKIFLLNFTATSKCTFKSTLTGLNSSRTALTRALKLTCQAYVTSTFYNVHSIKMILLGYKSYMWNFKQIH